MNTGGQKSSSTPLNAVTGSTPAGKSTKKKNMTEILAAHRIPYIATASPSDLNDMAAKVKKAQGMKGTKVIIILIPCLPGWGVADNSAVKVARMAVESGVFPLFEIEGGLNYTMNYSSKDGSVKEYLSVQKRFRHLSEEQIASIESDVDEDWNRIADKAGS